MHYFETIMTMEIRHRQSLVESHTFWAAIGAFLEINAELIDLDQRLVCREIGRLYVTKGVETKGVRN